jgi:hypothetical protein
MLCLYGHYSRIFTHTFSNLKVHKLIYSTLNLSFYRLFPKFPGISGKIKYRREYNIYFRNKKIFSDAK